MEFPHVNQSQAEVDAHHGEPYVCYYVTTEGDTEQHVFERGGFIDADLRMHEESKLYIGEEAIEQLVEDRLERYEQSGDPAWAIDALTVIGLFSEETSQAFSLPPATEQITSEVGSAVADTIATRATHPTDISELLLQLEGAPEQLRLEAYRKIGAKARLFSSTHPFIEAYTSVQKDLYGHSFFEAMEAFQKHLQDARK